MQKGQASVQKVKVTINKMKLSVVGILFIANAKQNCIESQEGQTYYNNNNKMKMRLVVVVVVGSSLQKAKAARAENRTRGPTMATLDFTTKPLALSVH